MIRLRKDIPKKGHDLNIYIKEKPHLEECDFWVVFYPPGELLSHEVIKAKTFSDIFAQVSAHGIKESQPLFYVDGSSSTQLYLLFYPETGYRSEEQWERWLEGLVTLLANTYPKALGLYFGEEISKTQNMKDHLVRLIDRLMAENITLDSLTLLKIINPGEHMVESAHYAQNRLKDQYNIAIKVAG